ncbi:MAG: hypothetical protein PHC75_05825 [Burkholderiales bacterium]|nr:hypothetical protein [Burkholderiales bacterium]
MANHLHGIQGNGIKTFATKLITALSMVYKDNLVLTNVQAFGNSYDVVIGDFDLVISYDRVYTVDELCPIMDMHKDYEANYGQNATGKNIRFNKLGKLVSDLGASHFYVASVMPDNEDIFIYSLLIDLANEMSNKEIYLNKIGYIENDINGGDDLGYPNEQNNLPNVWHEVY